jgi:IS30 family transposase
VSHETIYQSLYVQTRGALRRELASSLRSGRSHRRSRGFRMGGNLRELVSIAERPPEVDDRAVPGHWEGDLIIGKAGRSAIATLVERQTRFTMLIQLPDRTAESLRVALTEHIRQSPDSLRRSLTWDQGKEMAEHARFTVDSNVQVYFCDPSRPWQRGTNENTNGLLRQYFPKGDDLARYRQADLDRVADELNGRPRQAAAGSCECFISSRGGPRHLRALRSGARPLPVRIVRGAGPQKDRRYAVQWFGDAVRAAAL